MPVTVRYSVDWLTFVEWRACGRTTAKDHLAVKGLTFFRSRPQPHCACTCLREVHRSCEPTTDETA